MAAPEGNQFWKIRSKHGRDKLFATPELLWEAALEYFEWCDAHPYRKPEQKKGNTIIPKNFEGDISQLDNVIELETMRPYTMQALCLYLDCGVNYFNQFEDRLKGKEDELSKGFSFVITRIREIIQSRQIEGGMIGAYNPMLVSRIQGLTEKQDITSNGETVVSSVSFVFGVQSEGNKAIGEGVQHKLDKE